MDKYINKIIEGDCLEVMRGLPDNSVDLVLTDPPYGIGADKAQKAAAESRKKANWKSKAGRWYKDYWDTNRDDTIPSKEYFDEIRRVSKNQIIRWGNYFTEYLPPKMCWLVWDKWQREFSLADGELAWTSFDKAMRIYTVPRWRALQDWKVHPTQKSLELFKRCLDRFTEKWDIVLDCFAWSWTTWVAAKELNRNYILIEKEPKYVDIINKRLSNTTTPLFDL